MEESVIRLECLRLASCAPICAKSVTEIAEEYYNFIRGAANKPKPLKAVM